MNRGSKADSGTGMCLPGRIRGDGRKEIRAAVYTEEMARGMSEAAQRLGKTAYFHIKIDTGMGRIGFPVTEESASSIERISRLPNVQTEAMFTHFAKADELDKSYTLKQHRNFYG